MMAGLPPGWSLMSRLSGTQQATRRWRRRLRRAAPAAQPPLVSNLETLVIRASGDAGTTLPAHLAALPKRSEEEAGQQIACMHVQMESHWRRARAQHQRPCTTPWRVVLGHQRARARATAQRAATRRCAGRGTWAADSGAGVRMGRLERCEAVACAACPPTVTARVHGCRHDPQIACQHGAWQRHPFTGRLPDHRRARQARDMGSKAPAASLPSRPRHLTSSRSAT